MVDFIFTNPFPPSGIQVYGITELLTITVTVTGSLATHYSIDATFYTGVGVPIGTTVSGFVDSATVSATIDTVEATNYSWYVRATSSGFAENSETYSFDNMFLCSGTVSDDAGGVSGIPVRLYRRSNGSLIGSTTSAGTDGIFAIESTYNEPHYAVALWSDEDKNALIYDHLEPS